jgi:hypothetical protein
MKKYLKWLTESNRPQHIVVGFLLGLTLGYIAVISAACTAEVKDWLWNGKKGGIFGWVVGNGFDWLDLAATVLGGAVGYGIHLIIF